ncbi:MAG: PEP-CTERM sorting domain-containing protein [Gammaproteobacteria bacterium]|nr:PEP-CTERM sorting domain-containing protein [Gammaproteobacteria bacterium]
MKSTTFDSKTHHNSAAGKKATARQQHLWLATIVAVIAGSLINGPADARPIRFDFGQWTDVPFTTTDVNLGFNFDPFGPDSTLATIDPTGALVFSGGIIEPYNTQISYDIMWQVITDPLIDGAITGGFRACWGCDGFNNSPTDTSALTSSVFELGLFELSNGLFVMEFNYNALFEVPGNFAFETTNGIGFRSDSGPQQQFSNLGPYEDEFGVPYDLTVYGANDNCDDAPTSLACNSYLEYIFENPDVDNYFFADFNGDEAIGRYYFVFESDSTTVPEPGTGVLLLVGLGALGALRRRRIIAKVG